MTSAVLPDGAELAWWGVGEGEPLLLIAGQAVTHEAWDPVVGELAEHFRVLTYDHRGIGASTWGEPWQLTTRSLAEDAAAVLDAAGADRAHVWGHSLGGRVAQWLGIDHAERVDRVVLGATTGGGARGSVRTRAATAALTSGDPERLAPLFFTDAALARRPAYAALFTADAPRPVLMDYFRASNAHDSWAGLARIAAPTLVQHGSDDPITRVDHAELLAAGIPGARLEVFAGRRHGYYLESDAAVDSAVRHLAGQPR